MGTLRNLLREVYRRNIAPWTTRGIKIRGVLRRAHKLKPLTERELVPMVPISKIREWRRRFMAGDTSVSPFNIKRMLMAKPIRDRSGQRISGWGFPEKIANEIAGIVGNPKGVPRIYDPKVKTVGRMLRRTVLNPEVLEDKVIRSGRRFRVRTTKGTLPESFKSEDLALQWISENRPIRVRVEGQHIRSSMGRSPLPRYVNIGRTRSRMYPKVKYAMIRQYKYGKGTLSRKQRRLLAWQLRKPSLKFGMVSGKREVESGTGPYYKNRMRIIRDAEEWWNRDMARLKRRAITHGTGLVGGLATTGSAIYGHRKWRQKQRDEADQYYRRHFGKINTTQYSKILKYDRGPRVNRNLLKNLLISGFVIAGLGGLLRLLRAGSGRGLRVANRNRPSPMDSPPAVKRKIDNIVADSTVDAQTVSRTMNEYSNLPSGVSGQSTVDIAQREKEIEERGRAPYDRRDSFLEYRRQLAIMREIDRQRLRETEEYLEREPLDPGDLVARRRM